MPVGIARFLRDAGMEVQGPSAPQRVLMVIPQLGYGGAEGSFLRIAEFLARHTRVTLALMARDYGTQSGYSIDRILTDLPVIVLSEHSGGGGILRKGARWYRMRKRLAQLKATHDVTISFLSGANLLSALAGFPARTIVSERGSKRFETGRSTWSRLLWTFLFDKISYGRAAKIVAASNGLAQEIVEANPSCAERTLAIEGTINSRSLLAAISTPIAGKVEVLAHYDTVLAFGRLHLQKGFDFLLNVFAVVRKQRPRARLLIIGDGPESDSLRAQARRVGLRVGSMLEPERYDVLFAGFQDSPLRFARVSRCIVLTSRYEGLPNALIESVATGRPVLAADCPWGPRSVLAEEGDKLPEGDIHSPVGCTHGMLMPRIDAPGALDTWARELGAQLARSPALSAPKASVDAIKRFDIEVTGPRWLALVNAVASLRRVSSH